MSIAYKRNWLDSSLFFLCLTAQSYSLSVRSGRIHEGSTHEYRKNNEDLLDFWAASCRFFFQFDDFWLVSTSNSSINSLSPVMNVYQNECTVSEVNIIPKLPSKIKRTVLPQMPSSTSLSLTLFSSVRRSSRTRHVFKDICDTRIHELNVKLAFLFMKSFKNTF